MIKRFGFLFLLALVGPDDAKRPTIDTRLWAVDVNAQKLVVIQGTWNKGDFTARMAQIVSTKHAKVHLKGHKEEVGLADMRQWTIDRAEVYATVYYEGKLSYGPDRKPIEATEVVLTKRGVNP